MSQEFKEKAEPLVIMGLTGTCLSLIGSSFIIFMYFKYPKVKSFAFKLVIYLTFSDLLHGITFFIKLSDFLKDYILTKDYGCQIQAYFITSTILSSIIWTTIISYTLRKTVIQGFKNYKSLEKIYLFFGYIFPSLIALIPIFTDDYNPSGLYCWIAASDPKDSLRTFYYRLFLFFIPLWIAIIYNLIIYIQLIMYLNSLLQEKQDDLAFVNRLIFYPFTLIIIWIWATINRILEFMDSHDILWLTYLHIFFAGMMGFFNAIIYGLNDQIKGIIKKEILTCCEKKQSNNQAIISKLVSQESRSNSNDQLPIQVSVNGQTNKSIEMEPRQEQDQDQKDIRNPSKSLNFDVEIIDI